MIWAFDMDGVLTTNPDFFKLLTYWLTKKRNNNRVIVVTARNPDRKNEIFAWLDRWGITYNDVYFMPEDLARDPTTQGKWKKDIIRSQKVDLWFDNDFKWYEKSCKIDFSDLKCERIEI